MAEPGTKAFVCGHPVAHSRSPKIHGHWLSRYGIAGSYSAIDVAPDEFPTFIAGLRAQGFAGGNVTIPHKEAAWSAVERRDEAAEQIGAVNTLWFEDGVLFGGNTDAKGFAANLDDFAPGWVGSGAAAVLGAGGASRAIIHALQQRGFKDIRVINRTLSRALELADRFGAGVQVFSYGDTQDLLGDVGLLVNTTSLGMHGNSELPLDPALLPDRAIVTDIVYVPLQTPLLAAARDRGLKTVDGLGMLLHQAVPGFERWFGTRPNVTPELRALIVTDLGQRDMIVLGLTGSIGMGKSTTAKMFADAGVPVHDSDDAVHRLYVGKAAPLIEAAFPGVAVDGSVDRGLLASRVLGNQEVLRNLESIVHPLVRADADAFLARHRAANAPLAVLDIPLLFETGGRERVDKIVVVTAPAAIQRKRVLARPGMSEDRFEAILARQTPDAQKREQADFIVDTGQGMKAARRAVAGIIRELNGEKSGRRPA